MTNIENENEQNEEISDAESVISDAVSENKSVMDTTESQNKTIALPSDETVESSSTPSSDSYETGENTDAETHTESGKLDGVLEQLSSLNEKLFSLEKLFSDRISFTEYEEKVRDEMHKELQDFKNDFYAKLFMPLIMDIIIIRKDILKTAVFYQAKPEEEQVIPLKKYLYSADDLADLLEKYGISVFHSEPGSLFDPRTQNVIEKIPTSVDSLNKTILKSVSDGYRMNERILMYERVKVYIYEKPDDEKI